MLRLLVFVCLRYVVLKLGVEIECLDLVRFCLGGSLGNRPIGCCLEYSKGTKQI
jgi:hypothetical protein